jgi:acyl-coenzyme A synthetase/AMP-(fatty) acid ligase
MELDTSIILAHKRKKLANALTKKLGIKAGDIVGTLLGIMRLMWLYYGIAGIGACVIL